MDTVTAAWIQLAQKRLAAANIYTIENRFATLYNVSQETTLSALVAGKRREYYDSLPPFLQSTVAQETVFGAVPNDILLRILEESNEEVNYCTVYALHHADSPDSCNLPDKHLDKSGRVTRHACPLCKEGE